MKVMSVVSTRPELIKMAPVLKQLQTQGFESIFTTSGQHYDKNLFEVFVKELGLPEPSENLEVGSGTQAVQTAKALIGIEALIEKYSPDVVLAEGDTNSVLSTALACAKTNTPFGHVEAGLRSFDKTMPEEINRIIADHLSHVLFAPTQQACQNLLVEGISPEKIFVTGNTIVDACRENTAKTEKSSILSKLNFTSYCLMTVHRQENTSDKKRLDALCEILSALSAENKIIFPIHPRTKNALASCGLLARLEKNPSIQLLEPVGYFDFLALMKNADVILTDSGGIQEEATVLQKKCIILRENTERPEALEQGCVLAGLDKTRVLAALKHVKAPTYCPFGDGTAAEKIVLTLKKLDGKLLPKSFSFQNNHYPSHLLFSASEISGKTVKQISKEKNALIKIVFNKGVPTKPMQNQVLSKDDSVLTQQ